MENVEENVEDGQDKTEQSKQSEELTLVFCLGHEDLRHVPEVARRIKFSLPPKGDLEAQKTWRRLTGHEQIALVMAGRRFVDGEPEEAA